MNLEDIKSLSERTRDDGKRLFGVCEFIYKIAMIGVWFIGIVGGVTALIAMVKASFWIGFVIGIFVFIVCFVNYIIAVLTTHVAKVLVHTSFSNVAILEHLTKTGEA
jgi:hypothetical protein